MQAQARPDDWAAWFRLGTAYDAAGDRRRARAAVRHALQLHSAAHSPAHRPTR
jgi:Flp pilus assembly protein TadD